MIAAEKGADSWVIVSIKECRLARGDGALARLRLAVVGKELCRGGGGDGKGGRGRWMPQEVGGVMHRLSPVTAAGAVRSEVRLVSSDGAHK